MDQQRTQKNVIALNSKIYESRLEEKYCDVNIIVERKTFKCHRLVLGSASEYFDTMFSGGFKESTATDIVLQEIEATTFEQVLQFIYQGNVPITDTNAYDMIRASEFYKLPGLEELALQYFKSNIALIENVLDIFAFVRLTKKFDLIEVLSKYIRRHFDHYSKTPSFLDISFDDFDAILIQPSSTKNENVLLDAIIRWVEQGTNNHTSRERDKFFDKLLQRIDFKNVSPEYTEFMVKRYVKNQIVSTNETSSDAAASGAESLTDEKYRKSILSLHVYVNNSAAVSNVSVFTAQKYTGGFDWVYSCEVEPHHSCVLGSVVLNDRIYSLIKPPIAGYPLQTFSVDSSISLFSKRDLESPPTVVNRFNMCTVGNQLYLYNKEMFSNIQTPCESSEFEEEELSRGLFMYNCETDRWFPLPRMITKLANACMTYDNQRGLVYVIGGRNNQARPDGYVQAYDPRTQQWMNIPRSAGIYENAACCFEKGKLYVCGGFSNPKSAEIYDIAAGKWDVMKKLNENKQNPHITVYDDQLWVLDSNISTSGVEAYNFQDKKWKMLPSLYSSVIEYNSIQKGQPQCDVVIGSILFKALGL